MFAKYYTERTVAVSCKLSIWCYCKMSQEEDNLIGFDDKECKMQWFHIKCLLISQTIKDKWKNLKCKK